jgi:hypothetical protein
LYDDNDDESFVPEMKKEISELEKIAEPEEEIADPEEQPLPIENAEPNAKPEEQPIPFENMEPIAESKPEEKEPSPKEQYIDFLKSLQDKSKLEGTALFQNIEFKERMQMRNQLLEHPYKPFVEKENDLNILLIKEPELPEKALEDLETHRPTEEFVIDGDETGPSTIYHYNQINSWDSIREALYD